MLVFNFIDYFIIISILIFVFIIRRIFNTPVILTDLTYLNIIWIYIIYIYINNNFNILLKVIINRLFKVNIQLIKVNIINIKLIMELIIKLIIELIIKLIMELIAFSC